LAKQAAIEVVERNLHVRELDESMTILLHNLRRIADRQVIGKPVNGGKPGAVTRRLQGIYTENVKAFLK